MPSLAPDDAFGADLYRALGGSGNLVFSPGNIATALRMALLGARGETAAQLAAVVHLAKPQDAEGGLLATSALLGSLAGDDLTLRAPNTMWAQSGLPVQPDFTAALAQAASAQLRTADFAHAAEQARQEINELITEQTAGKITGLIGPGGVTARTRLVLASAIYLKAAWVTPFPAAATADAPFHPAPGRDVPVPTMRLRARLRYLRGDGYQVAELPYTGGRLGMAIVLPDGPLPPAEGRLASGGLGGLLAGLAPHQVSLALPRFRVTGEFSLRPVLSTLGMPLAFGHRADFTGITTAEPLHVDDVLHKAYIDVDEQGTEAAAATAVTIRAAARVVRPDPPVEMIVDRPFLFAITDTGSGLPLFLGRVTDPGRELA
ncbi:MAG TPA: serpin family protein [Streptosporangiaceae bacterium]|nr:serpin family protein [Streptosporangiaceae bacterium]